MSRAKRVVLELTPVGELGADVGSTLAFHGTVQERCVFNSIRVFEEKELPERRAEPRDLWGHRQYKSSLGVGLTHFLIGASCMFRVNGASAPLWNVESTIFYEAMLEGTAVSLELVRTVPVREPERLQVLWLVEAVR